MLIHLPREDGYGVIPRTKNGPALAGYGAVRMKDALAATMTTLPEQLRRSLTWDRGKELSQHLAFKVETGIAIYFADPKSPWQRGTNENTNGLLRQYFPKGTDLSRWTADEIEAVATTINNRPCETSAGRHQRKSSTSTYARSNKPALRPPIEPAQFTSWSFSQRVRAAGLAHSLGSVGDAFDNAVVESFWARM